MLNRRIFCFILAFTSAWIGVSILTFAQQKKADEYPKMERKTLVTKEDRFPIVASWFPGRNGKKSAVVIMLHGFGKENQV
jgi:hypothetical protein